MSMRGIVAIAALSASVLLSACGAGSPAASPDPSDSFAGVVATAGSLPGPEPIEASCSNLRTLLEAAGRPGDERWDVLAVRIFSLSLQAESDSDRTSLVALSDAAQELNRGSGGRQAWESARAVIGGRCAAVGTPLP